MKIITVKPTIELEHKGKEGLLLRDGKVMYDDSWLHEDMLDKSIDNVDIVKATRGPLNRSKLIRKPVQVRGKNGKIFTRMQWVNPETGQVVAAPSHAKQEPNKNLHSSEDNDIENIKDSVDKFLHSIDREKKYELIESLS